MKELTSLRANLLNTGDPYSLQFRGTLRGVPLFFIRDFRGVKNIMIAAYSSMGSSYNPHISKDNPYYLHYYAINVQSWGNSSALIAESPESILEAAKNKISIARAKQQQQIQKWAAEGDIDLKEAADIEYLMMNSDWLENFEPATTVNGGLSFPDIPPTDLDKASAAVQDAVNVLSKNGESLTKIQEILSHIDGYDAGTIDRYAELLQNYFTGKAFATRVPLSGLRSTANTTWQKSALEAILSRQNSAFFSSGGQYKGEFKEWSADKTKLLTSLKLLQDPQLPQYVQTLAKEGVTIKHGTGEQYISNNAAEILQAFFDKIKNYFNQMDAIGLEAGAGLGVIKSQKEVGIEFDKLHTAIQNFSGKGNIQVTTDFSETKDFFDAVNNQAYNRAQMRAKKSDAATISISENGVTVSQGITVKKDRKLNFNPSYPSSANFVLQRSTPLLTLLAREAGLNNNQLFSIVQLLAAHGSDGDYESALVNQWNAAMQTVKYKAFLDTLAGFTNELEDAAFYMLINDHIYDIVTIVDSLKETTKNYVDWTIDSKSIDGSLDYEDYNALNPWFGEGSLDYESAEARSQFAFKAINTKLYETKIRVTLHIAELATLAALNF